MKKTKAAKQDQFIFHIAKPLAGYGLPRKRKSNPQPADKSKKI